MMRMWTHSRSSSSAAGCASCRPRWVPTAKHVDFSPTHCTCAHIALDDDLAGIGRAIALHPDWF